MPRTYATTHFNSKSMRQLPYLGMYLLFKGRELLHTARITMDVTFGNHTDKEKMFGSKV